MKANTSDKLIREELDFTIAQSEQSSVVLDAYLRNIREISRKIDQLSDDESYSILKNKPEGDECASKFFDIDMDLSREKTSLLASLEDQTQETLDLLKREASENLALHIALEDHLMEQMEQTQNKLRQNIGLYLEVIRQLNDLQDCESETEGLVQ